MNQTTIKQLTRLSQYTGSFVAKRIPYTLILILWTIERKLSD